MPNTTLCQKTYPQFDGTIPHPSRIRNGGRPSRFIGRLLVYERVDHDRRPMTLPSRASTIGLGSAGRELFWDVRQQAVGLFLDIASDTELTCSLVQNEVGEWRGRWFHAECMPIVVRHSSPIYLEEQDDPSSDAERLEISANPALKVADGANFTREYPLRAFSQDRSDFTSVRDSNVLIYFRHGFGDWVTLSYILPLLNQSNRYWITRFGDDYTSVMEGSNFVTPLYLGSNSIMCDDGRSYYNQHFGLDLDKDGRIVQGLSTCRYLFTTPAAQTVSMFCCI